MAHQSTRYVGDWIVIEARPNKFALSRLGITVTKRYGKATIRNRFKRVVREAFRLCRQQIKSGFDLNIKPRNLANTAKMQDVMGEFLRFLAKIR
ncbi:MAG: ribonuclease P protein component [Parachlamydiaceae bacterium]|nr:ribonuclease P protein component [Parachlamydiaceae bacterium]